MSLRIRTLTTLPTQLYIFLSTFVNNQKTFVSDYHLNDPTILLHNQIKVSSAHARILVSGYKNQFSVLHVLGLVILQNRAHIQNLERSHRECMRTGMSKFTTQSQELPLIFVTRKSVVLWDQRLLTTLPLSLEIFSVSVILC